MSKPIYLNFNKITIFTCRLYTEKERYAIGKCEVDVVFSRKIQYNIGNRNSLYIPLLMNEWGHTERFSDMITLLSKFFIKNPQDASSATTRQAYGILCGSLGIALNLLLFAGKFFAGWLSGSIAITADAFNNLSDAGSSVITLFGFKMAGQKPDKDHPFGHGRFEYIAGLLVSMVILYMAFELIQSSVMKIITPTPLTFSPIVAGILVASILVKGYMAFYNFRISAKINSAAMKATATDSLSDTLATSGVLIATLVSHFTDFSIDGYCGVAVALFIFHAGINAAKDTVSPLLGQAPDPEFVQKINDIVLSYEGVIGIHDLIVHNYGPGRVLISLIRMRFVSFSTKKSTRESPAQLSAV